jgi:hypothetical protein
MVTPRRTSPYDEQIPHDLWVKFARTDMQYFVGGGCGRASDQPANPHYIAYPAPADTQHSTTGQPANYLGLCLIFLPYSLDDPLLDVGHGRDDVLESLSPAGIVAVDPKAGRQGSNQRPAGCE